MAEKREIEIVVQTGQATKNVQGLTKEVQNTQKAATDTKKAFSGVGSFIDKMTGGLISKFQGVTKSVGGITKGFGSLRGAIIATGLGALVVLVGSLIEYFTNFEAGVRIVNQVMNTLAGTVNAIVANFEKLLKGDFLGFFKGVANGAKEAYENTNQLFEAERKLFEMQRDLTVQNAKLNAEIQSYARQTRDTTLSLSQRLEAQDNLNKSAEKLIKNERDLARAELDRLKIELALENNYKKRQELELAIQKTMAGLIDVESRLQAQLDKGAKERRQIVEEEKKQQEERVAKAREVAEKIRKTREDEKKALLDIEKSFIRQIEDLEDDTEELKLKRAKERALQQIEQMKGTEADKEKARLQVLEFYAQKEFELIGNRIDRQEKAEEDRLAKVAKLQEEFEFKRRELEAVTEAEQQQLELDKLERDRLAKEAELIQLGVDEQQRLEILESFAIQRDNINKKYSDLELQREQILQQQKLQLVSNSFGLMAQIMGENNKAGKAFAIAQALMNTYQGITTELATKTFTPFEFALKAFNVAKVSAMGFMAVRNIAKTNPTTSPSASPVSGGAGGGMQMPNFNVIGTGVGNQIAETLGQQQTVMRAFVVGNEVTTQQSLDRNIIQTASLG